MAGRRVKRSTRGRKKSEPPLDPHRTYLDFWESLTPGERLIRSFALRKRLPDPQAVHDAKLFPRP